MLDKLKLICYNYGAINKIGENEMKKVMLALSLMVAMVMSVNAMATTVSVGVATLVSNTGTSLKVGLPIFKGNEADVNLNVVGESYNYTLFGTNVTNTVIGANVEIVGGFTGASEVEGDAMGNFEAGLNKWLNPYVNIGYASLNTSATIAGIPMNSSIGALTYGIGIQAPREWNMYYSVGYRGLSIGQASMGGVVADVGIRF